MFRSSRPDFIETQRHVNRNSASPRLFRSSRPDFIETTRNRGVAAASATHCSGLPGRTSLRRHSRVERYNPCADCSGLPGRTSLRLRSSSHAGCARRRRLFRSSRPDFIETLVERVHAVDPARNCSGLPGRTSLRREYSWADSERLADCIVPVFQAGLH